MRHAARSVETLDVFATRWLGKATDGHGSFLTPTEMRLAVWLAAYGYVYPEGLARVERTRPRETLGLEPRAEQQAMSGLIKKGVVHAWERDEERWFALLLHDPSGNGSDGTETVSPDAMRERRTRRALQDLIARMTRGEGLAPGALCAAVWLLARGYLWPRHYHERRETALRDACGHSRWTERRALAQLVETGIAERDAAGGVALVLTAGT